MDKKVQKHMDGLNASACKSQGGAVRGSGPDTVGDPKVGDSIKSQFKKQENSRKQGGTPKNKYFDV